MRSEIVSLGIEVEIKGCWRGDVNLWARLHNKSSASHLLTN